VLIPLTDILRSEGHLSAGQVESIDVTSSTPIFTSTIAFLDVTYSSVFPFLKGNPKTALIDPFSIVLTEATARKYFGAQDPLGKVLTVNDTISLKVTGVLALE